jgi:hypothetical protein
MILPAQPLSHFLQAVAFRAALGGCLIFMARSFYANPADSFRNSAQVMQEYPWLLQLVRAIACFCLWGGCFILTTVVAVQIFGLHGNGLAVSLVTLSAIGAWLLLPNVPDASAQDRSSIESTRRPK